MQAEISRVAVRFPPFWAERPAVWFAQAEAKFPLAGVNSEKTPFYYVISQLDHRYATEVEDIITSLPEQGSYTTLRTELIRRLSPSREQRIHQLLMLKVMGDSKPSQFLRHLRSLVPDVPDDFLRSIWSSRLPTNVQDILAGQHEDSLDAAARSADRILQILPQPVLANVGPLPPAEKSALLQKMEDLPHQVAAIRAEQDRLRANFRTPTAAPAPGIAGPAPGPAARAADPHPEMTLHPALVVISVTSEPERKGVLLPATTASRKTNTADINGGSCLHPKHRPPLRYGYDQ
jgi:hypothetical protein